MKTIAQKRKKVDLFGCRCYVGVDVHKKTYYTALLSEDGRRQEFSTPAEPYGFLSQLREMGIEILSLAHETGPTGFGLAWACQQLGVPVVVAAASKIPRPVSAGGKNDRLDAMKLADYLARGLLKSVAIPTYEEWAFREMERRRQQLAQKRKKLRQGIKSFLLRSGFANLVEIKSWSGLEVEALSKLELDNPYLQAALDSLLSEHKMLLGEIKKMQQRLAEEAVLQGKKELIKNLRTIPGVGEIVAHTFVAEVFRPERFDRAEEICAYVGLAPIISQSGQGQGKAYLRRVGQNYLRALVVEAAWVAIRYDKGLRLFYGRILSRTQLPAKAIAAVARKLLIVIWRIAVENRPYRPSAE